MGKVDTKAALSTVDAGDGWETVAGGGLEPVAGYYSFKAPATPKPGLKYNVLEIDTTIQGFYEGTFPKKAGFGTTHKVRTDAGLFGVGGTAQLDRALAGVKNGTEVMIIYRGKTRIKTGPNAGKLSHNFIVKTRGAGNGSAESA